MSNTMNEQRKFFNVRKPKKHFSILTGFLVASAIFILLTNSDVGADEKASPEVGYGVKSEKEILKEKPRASRIGVLGPMSGELEFYGMEASNGAELASDELNASGGIRMKDFELLVFDTRGAMSGARKGVETFLQHDTLAVVGAATGEVSFASNKILNERQLLMISAGSRRRLGDTGPYNFRDTLNDAKAIKGLVDYVVENRNWKKFVLFSSVLNDYSIKLTASFKQELLKRNLTVSHELYLWSAVMANVMPEERSVAGQLALLKGEMPDVIIFTGNGKEAVDLKSEMKAQGIDIPLIGGEDIMTPDFISLGESVKGTLVYSGFDVRSENPKVKAFVKAYTERFKSPPSRLAALSYDAYYLLAEAIVKAKSLRPSHVRMALLTIKDFVGVTGKTTIGPTGEAIKNPFIFEFKKVGDEHMFVGVKDPF